MSCPIGLQWVVMGPERRVDLRPEGPNAEQLAIMLTTTAQHAKDLFASTKLESAHVPTPTTSKVLAKVRHHSLPRQRGGRFQIALR